MKKWFKVMVSSVVALSLLLCLGCVSKSQYEELESNYTSLQSEHEALQSDYEDLESKHGELQAEYDEIKGDYESLQAKYPPRLFENASELESWLTEQPNPPTSADAVLWYNHARNLQEAAAKAGYIISSSIEGPDEHGMYMVWCSAVLADYSYYQWDPDTDDIYYCADVRHF